MIDISLVLKKYITDMTRKADIDQFLQQYHNQLTERTSAKQVEVLTNILKEYYQQNEKEFLIESITQGIALAKTYALTDKTYEEITALIEKYITEEIPEAFPQHLLHNKLIQLFVTEEIADKRLKSKILTYINER